MGRTTEDISTEEALQLVANKRCRSILTQLIESEENAVSLTTLVEQIAPANSHPTTRDAAHTKPIAMDLHHNHLPKLEDAGLIDYDKQSATVCYYPNEDVERLHQFVTAERD